MAYGLNHPQQLRLRPLARPPRERADNSRHPPFLERFLCGPEPMAVPKPPKFPKLGEHRFRNVVHEPVVQAQAQNPPSRWGQGNVVTRQLDPLKPVVALEVGQTISLLFPVRESGVPKVWDLPLGTGPDRLGNQRIRRSLVPVLDHRHDLH